MPARKARVRISLQSTPVVYRLINEFSQLPFRTLRQQLPLQVFIVKPGNGAPLQIEIKTIPLILYMRTGQTSCGRSGRPRLVLHVYAIPGEAQSRHVPDINIPIRPVRTALASLGRNAAPRRIRNFKNFVARQKLMVDIHLGYSAITPVQCIEHRYGRHIRLRDERLQQSHHRFAQQPGMPVSLPRIRLFQRALLPCLPAIRVAHTLTIPERMLIIEKQGFVHVTHLPHHPLRQLGSGQLRQGQAALPGNRMGMSGTGNSRFACSGSKTIRPPVRPRSPNDRYPPGIIPLHGLDKVRSDCRTQFRPFILFIPTFHHLATPCGRRSVVGQIPGMLNGANVVRVSLSFQLSQIIPHALLELCEIIRVVHAPVVPQMVMFRTISQDFLPRWRLPPEYCGLVEAYQGPMPVRPHIQVLHSRVGKIFTETPGYSVYIVLHGQLRP